MVRVGGASGRVTEATLGWPGPVGPLGRDAEATEHGPTLDPQNRRIRRAIDLRAGVADAPESGHLDLEPPRCRDEDLGATIESLNPQVCSAWREGGAA